MDNLTDELIIQTILSTVPEYGLEGTLEAIERVYSSNPTIKNKFLKNFKLIYGI